jgi:hypothetical protein
MQFELHAKKVALTAGMKEARPPKSALVDETGALRPAVSSQVRSHAAIIYGGSFGPHGEIIGINPESRADWAAIVEVAESMLLSGEERTVGSAVNRAARSIGVDIPGGSKSSMPGSSAAREPAEAQPVTTDDTILQEVQGLRDRLGGREMDEDTFNPIRERMGGLSPSGRQRLFEILQKRTRGQQGQSGGAQVPMAR